ncbi:hypothetical protein INT45_000064 [Circinella minor]|uniref:DDE Tnp4 domain-containing protein n=1 Tax=Circinella minor TaxID=1195481 RepID=A0A8H7RV77_9FUNG|nr:hypothetical protein INT45_000064 [Circinella minor]
MPNIADRKKILDMTADYIVAEAISDFLFNDDDDDLDIRNLFNNNSTFMLDDDEMFDDIDEQDINTNLDYSYCSNNDDDLFDLTPTQMIHIAVASSTYLESKGWVTIPTSNYMSSVVFNLPEKEFKQDARMTYEAFYDLVDKIKNDQVFQNNSYICQAPVREQLIVALIVLGCTAMALLLDKLLDILELELHRTDEVYWPTPAEKHNIKETIQSSSGFPNCIGCVNGTGIVLSYPPVDNEEDFFNRKSDDLALNSQRYFDGEEYLLGDKGYLLYKEIITLYKEPRAQHPDNKTFNFCLSSPRVRVEDAIGVLKGRFQSLRGLCIVIGKGKSKKKDQARAVLWFHACVVLHNILLKYQDTDEWFDPTIEEEDEIEDSNSETQSFNANFADADIKQEYIKRLVLNFNSGQEE